MFKKSTVFILHFAPSLCFTLSLQSAVRSLRFTLTGFSSLFAAGDVSRETSPAAKSEEKRMFSQASRSVKRFRRVSATLVLPPVSDSCRGEAEARLYWELDINYVLYENEKTTDSWQRMKGRSNLAKPIPLQDTTPCPTHGFHKLFELNHSDVIKL